MSDEHVQERVARNESIFRDANEQISAAAVEHGVEVVPFVCECAEPECRAILRVPLDEYERVRRDPTQFVTAPGHWTAARGHARVVAENDGYIVVEKLDHAGEVAAELAGDPESEPEEVGR